MHEWETQKWVNKNSLFKWIMQIMSIFMFSMSDIIQPLKMQI